VIDVPDRPVRRAVAVAVLGLGVAAGAAAITILSLIMRSVTEIGGSCADGGPYVSAQPCPSGTGTALLLVFASVFVCIIGTLWAAPVLQAPMPLLLGWPALFLTLGWNFLESGVDPPSGQGIDVGFVVCGVIFVLMGGLPLLLWASVGAREARRDRRAQERLLPIALPPVHRPAATSARVPAPRPQPDDLRASAMSVAGRLERLAALHASGALTDEEYTRAKRATLDEELDR
jgi:hypothetical protein